MGKLIHVDIVSLDGRVNDENGKFGWAEPVEEVHRFMNDLARPLGTHLNGRRMYEVMVFWETVHEQPDVPDYILDYSEIWRSAEKVVYSTTLAEPRSARTRIERTFDAEAVRALKESSAKDLSIGGANLAAQAHRAGLVDEVHLVVCPVIVGSGTRSLPEGVHRNLRLLDQHTFSKGTLYLRYAVEN
ncbi:dihydrofolate reductase family protein [Sphaerisporangium rubeum]|uniref:Dihydrofolate reductase n=1 Tax=Sphaerisporangium rubeum TaxID=321317 RepID=A0A7X0IJ90_9ACTN|nr:dihydrofolate reductase family protein [Sphaerisporangium rubeum]MBB6475704.1 dihydrofolate reductase [Sphaerisporangium rubeum]